MADGQVALRNVTLDDKYDLSKDHVFITGTQAVIRMLLMQRERDRLAGLSTAGFVSGYRGSPSAASTRISGAPGNGWRPPTSSSSRGSTRNLPRPPSGARSRRRSRRRQI